MSRKGYQGRTQHHTDPEREQLQPKTAAVFNARLSAIANNLVEQGQDISQYQRIADLKKQLYNSGFSNSATEGKMAQHPILSYDLQISHGLSRILRHGGQQLEDVANEINFYDTAYSEHDGRPPLHGGMLPVSLVASQLGRVGRYIMADPDLFWFVKWTNNKDRFVLEVRESLPISCLLYTSPSPRD